MPVILATILPIIKYTNTHKHIVTYTQLNTLLTETKIEGQENEEKKNRKTWQFERVEGNVVKLYDDEKQVNYFTTNKHFKIIIHKPMD